MNVRTTQRQPLAIFHAKIISRPRQPHPTATQIVPIFYLKLKQLRFFPEKRNVVTSDILENIDLILYQKNGMKNTWRND